MKVLEAAYVKDANLENSSMLQNIIFDVAKEFGKNKTELLNQLQNSISDKLLEQRCAKESEAFLLEYKFNKLENYEARKESFKTFYLDAVKLYGNDNQFENTNTTINELNLLNDKYPEFALFSNEVIQAIRNTKAVGTKDKERYLSQDVVKNEIKQPNKIDGLKSYFTDAVVNELPKEKVLGFAYKIVYDWGGMTPECKQDITSKLSKRHTENMDQHNHQHNTYISLFTEPKKTNRLIEILKQKDATKNNNTMLENFNVDEFASDIPFDVLISMLEIGKRLESNEGKKQHGIIESWQDFKKDSSLANFGKVIINVITAIMNAIPILINMFQDKEINKGLESLAQHVKSISMHDNTEKKDLLQGKITSFLKAVPQHEERKR